MWALPVLQYWDLADTVKQENFATWKFCEIAASGGSHQENFKVHSPCSLITHNGGSLLRLPSQIHRTQQDVPFSPSNLILGSIKGLFPTPNTGPFSLPDIDIQTKISVGRHRHSEWSAWYSTLNYSPTLTFLFPSWHRTFSKFRIDIRHSDPPLWALILLIQGLICINHPMTVPLFSSIKATTGGPSSSSSPSL